MYVFFQNKKKQKVQKRAPLTQKLVTQQLYRNFYVDAVPISPFGKHCEKKSKYTN